MGEQKNLNFIPHCNSQSHKLKAMAMAKIGRPFNGSFQLPIKQASTVVLAWSMDLLFWTLSSFTVVNLWQGLMISDMRER